MKRAQGDGQGALAAYEAAVASDRKRAAEDAANPVAQQDISIDLDRIADIKLFGGDSSGALKAYEESLAIRRKLVAADPFECRAPAGAIGQSRQDLRREARRGRRQGRARRVRGGSLDIARRIAASDPGNTELQRDVAIGLERLGGLKLGAGDFGAGLGRLRGGAGGPPPPGRDR